MAVPDVLMAGREPPQMGPVAHGFAALGDAAERAVSQLAAVLDDAVQAPSRLSEAAALLTGDGRVGTLWQVTAPFGGVLLGAMAVALAVHQLLKPHHSRWACCARWRSMPHRWRLMAALLRAVVSCCSGPRACLLRNRNVPNCRQSDHQHVRRRLAPDRGAGGSVGCASAAPALCSNR